MKISPNDLCPCYSGNKYKKCCRPHHQRRNAPSPLTLMRSRYSAYALGLVDYIIITTHPDSPHYLKPLNHWKQDIAAFCEHTHFTGLQIVDYGIAEIDQQGFVTFKAKLIRTEKDASFTERSIFKKHTGKWFYFSGEIP